MELTLEEETILNILKALKFNKDTIIYTLLKLNTPELGNKLIEQFKTIDLNDFTENDLITLIKNIKGETL